MKCVATLLPPHGVIPSMHPPPSFSTRARWFVQGLGPGICDATVRELTRGMNTAEYSRSLFRGHQYGDAHSPRALTERPWRLRGSSPRLCGWSSLHSTNQANKLACWPPGKWELLSFLWSVSHHGREDCECVATLLPPHGVCKGSDP